MHAIGGIECASDAREFLAALDQRGLTLELTYANLIVKLPDPNGSGKTFSLFGINKGGDLWIERLPEQTIAAGIEYAGSPAETFLHTLSRVLRRELKHQRGKAAPDYWGKNIPLDDARPHLDAVLSAVDDYLATFEQRQTQP
ncbi:MAG: hypothetical protein LC667_04115 [Thioalkalivibrio sp.]|nr:hypothetical protein [Thioalkalivibrio sp.]